MKSSPAKRTKLGIDIEPKLKKRLDHEAVDAGLTLKELVDLRLRESYRSHPGQIRSMEATASV